MAQQKKDEATEPEKQETKIERLAKEEGERKRKYQQRMRELRGVERAPTEEDRAHNRPRQAGWGEPGVGGDWRTR